MTAHVAKPAWREFISPSAILPLVTQLAAVVWFAASVHADIRTLGERVTKVEQDVRSLEGSKGKVEVLEERLRGVIASLEALTQRFDRYFQSKGIK